MAERGSQRLQAMSRGHRQDMGDHKQKGFPLGDSRTTTGESSIMKALIILKGKEFLPITVSIIDKSGFKYMGKESKDHWSPFKAELITMNWYQMSF